MKYEILEPTPVKRTIKVMAPEEEVNAALATTIALRRRTA